jgi:hypothetical protein
MRAKTDGRVLSSDSGDNSRMGLDTKMNELTARGLTRLWL